MCSFFFSKHDILQSYLFCLTSSSLRVLLCTDWQVLLSVLCILSVNSGAYDSLLGLHSASILL